MLCDWKRVRRFSVLFLAVFVALCAPLFARAGLTDVVENELPLDYERAWKSDHTYYVPNEQFPQDGRGVLEKAPPGIYVSVGSERGFIGASLTKQPEGILFLDSSPKVTAFNRANAILLKIARDRKDYLRLRFEAGIGDLKTLAQSKGVSEEEMSVLDSVWKNGIWYDIRKKTTTDPDGLYLMSKPNHLLRNRPFAGANYLHDDRLFKKLQALAQENKIKSIWIRLGNTKEIEKIVSEIIAPIHSAPEKIGVLDLSNAWWPPYLDAEDLAALLHQIQPLAQDRSLLLLTDQHMAGSWHYFAYEFKDIRRFASEKDFVTAFNPAALERKSAYYVTPNAVNHIDPDVPLRKSRINRCIFPMIRSFLRIPIHVHVEFKEW